MRISYSILFILIAVLVSCNQNSPDGIERINLPKISGEKSWIEVVNSPNKVFYFLAPECPLCQNYAVAMRDLSNKFPEVEFIGIFPGKEYSAEEVRKYLIRYDLNFNAYFDPEFKLTDSLDAEITPEAFLISENGEVLYSGAIDNWAISLGQKRTVITKKYLEDAIHAYLEGIEVKTKKSKAVGCFIQ